MLSPAVSLCQPTADSPSRSRQRLLLLRCLPVIFQFRDPVFLFPVRPSLVRGGFSPPGSSSTVNWYTPYLFPRVQMENNSLTIVFVLSLWVWETSSQRRNTIFPEPIEKIALSHTRNNVFSTRTYRSYPFLIPPQLLEQATSSRCQQWAGHKHSYLNGTTRWLPNFLELKSTRVFSSGFGPLSVCHIYA